MLARRFAFWFTSITVIGCAAGAGKTDGGSGAQGGTANSGGSTANSGTNGSAATFMTTVGAGGSGGFASCATFEAAAVQAPAAMIFVLDRSASMVENGKWGAAQIAIVQAIDNDVFNSMSLGMLTFPDPTSVPGPACIFNYPIYCAVSALPQVAVQPAGTSKSTDPTGVRHDIYQYLVMNNPESDDMSDSSPIYAALNGAYQFIQSVPGVDKRIVALITDGGGSCTSISMPKRAGYVDGNGCADWEEPPVMANLIANANINATTPVDTFIVGVPGSNSTGNMDGTFDTPPYNMLLALSTYAVAGSPTTIDPTCDSTAVFTQTGAAPTKPCHIDLSSGTAFNATALAAAIASIRGKALGCTYDLPTPPPGKTISPDQVNVEETVNGVTSTIPKRKSASDMCASSPCWDYDANGKVDLIGAACTAVTTGTSATVEIVVGCNTIID